MQRTLKLIKLKVIMKYDMQRKYKKEIRKLVEIEEKKIEKILVFKRIRKLIAMKRRRKKQIKKKQ